MTRFPDIHQSLPPEPINEAMIGGIVLVCLYCFMMYLLPLIGLAYLVRDRLIYTQRLGAIGAVLCVAAPLVWAGYNPFGVWFLLLPILAPAAFASYLLYVNAKRRLYHRNNPTNLIPFRPRSKSDTPRSRSG